MPSEMATAVIKGDRMAIIQRQTTIVFVLCRNKFSVARKNRFKCLFNFLTYDIYKTHRRGRQERREK
jgi:hypothetical protein